MKKNIILCLMSLLFFIAESGQAQETCYENSCCEKDFGNFYGKILSGVNFLQNTALNGNEATYEAGYVIAGSIGYCCQYGFRLEAEYAFRRNSVKKIEFFTEGSSKHGRLQTASYMFNVLWDLPLSSWGSPFWNIQPFIGAGVGYDFLHMHSSNSRVVFQQKWNRLSWQVMTGVAYPIFCNAELALEYKFHQGGSHFYNHSLGVGLTYKFGSSEF